MSELDIYKTFFSQTLICSCWLSEITAEKVCLYLKIMVSSKETPAISSDIKTGVLSLPAQLRFSLILILNSSSKDKINTDFQSEEEVTVCIFLCMCS